MQTPLVANLPFIRQDIRMDRARVVVFEDMPRARRQIEASLVGSEHRIVGEAPTMAKARILVKKLVSGELEADVIVLDGNLKPVANQSEICNDAAEIAQALRDNGVTAKIIGFSAEPMRTDISIDIDLGKQHFDRLAEVIDCL